MPTEKELENAKKLVADDARKKAEASARVAAKDKAEAEAAERKALTPEQRLGKDWPKKHTELAPYITELGKVRTNLNVPDIVIAKNILKSYGFNVR